MLRAFADHAATRGRVDPRPTTVERITPTASAPVARRGPGDLPYGDWRSRHCATARRRDRGHGSPGSAIAGPDAGVGEGACRRGEPGPAFARGRRTGGRTVPGRGERSNIRRCRVRVARGPGANAWERVGRSPYVTGAGRPIPIDKASTTFATTGSAPTASGCASTSFNTCGEAPRQKYQNAPTNSRTASAASAPAPPGAHDQTGASRNEVPVTQLHMRAAAAKPIITKEAASRRRSTHRTGMPRALGSVPIRVGCRDHGRSGRRHRPHATDLVGGRTPSRVTVSSTRRSARVP